MSRLLSLAVLLLVPALAPAPAGADDARDEAFLSFQRFAGEWVGTFQGKTFPGEPKGPVLKGTKGTMFADRVPERRVRDLRFEIRPTGDRAVPYVGVLRYLEELLDCRPEATAGCVVVRSSPITEIFPYQGGRWRH